MMFSYLIDKNFDLEFLAHSNALLQVDFPDASSELESVLSNFRISVTELVQGGGGEATLTQRMRRAFYDIGWKKENFVITKTINGRETEATTHEVDHVKSFPNGVIAMEIEWNNKDPFYDRDLENFKRLHADNGISLGIIITRGVSLQNGIPELIKEYGRRHNLNSHDRLENHGLELTSRQKNNIDKLIALRNIHFHEAWASWFVKDKFGQATTHWRKLKDRIDRGVGRPCPFIGIGLPIDLVIEDD